MLMRHSPPLYGYLYGHVQVWNSICCADMARAGWITEVCGYTNSTDLPFNYWLLLYVKNSFNQMVVKHSNVITFHCFTCLYFQFVKGFPMSWMLGVFFFGSFPQTKSILLRVFTLFVILLSVIWIIRIMCMCHRTRHRGLYRDHRDIC